MNSYIDSTTVVRSDCRSPWIGEESALLGIDTCVLAPCMHPFNSLSVCYLTCYLYKKIAHSALFYYLREEFVTERLAAGMIAAGWLAAGWPAAGWFAAAGVVNQVIVRYVVGTDVSSIPKPLIQGMMLVISDLYDQRNDRVKALPTASEYLWNPYRIFTF